MNTSVAVDVTMASNSNIVLDPAESLSFHLKPHVTAQTQLHLTNLSTSEPVAFKVKTTRPLRYLVRPNQGIIPPNGTASIVVVLQEKDCEELLRLDAVELQLSNDKFLVQSIPSSVEFYEEFRAKNAKEASDELGLMWAKAEKKKITNQKLKCRFHKEEEPGLEDLDDRGVARTESATAMEQGANVTRDQSDMHTSTQLSSALLQDPQERRGERKTVAFQDNPVTSTKISSSAMGSNETYTEVANLRKKYDELVAFTVQLTAQRDVLMNDLEKTRQQLQKTNSELQKSKKMNPDTGLRQRKPGNGHGNSAEDISTRDKNVQDPKTLNYFQLFVLAVIFFLLGRHYA